ncbi:MAG TPA: fibronectin type III domain-containing protein [Thermoleophilaceae bacterium]
MPILTAAATVAALLVAGLGLPSAARAGTVTPACTLSDDSPTSCDVWHSDQVTLRWGWDPSGETGTNGCDTRTFTDDTPAGGTTVTCTVNWQTIFAGNTATVLVDRTPPVVASAIPARAPDHDGWYNHPVAFSFQGSDTPSGLASCATVVYSGPDSASGSVTGGCTDLAGNRATASFPVAYDSSPPAPAQVIAAPGNRSITLSWQAPPDAAVVSVVRSATGAGAAQVVYDGRAARATDRGLRNGVRYHYVVTVFDQAGNATATRLSAVPTASTLRPADGVPLAAPPRLTWAPVRGARYYNVQLMRKGHKILSAWPHGPHLQLRAAWTFRGKKHRLVPGAYRWYVWPGYGNRRAHRYGALLGSSVFRVRP